MALYRIIDNKAVRWTSEPINGISYTKDIEYKWTTEELQAIGLFRPKAADPLSPNKVSTGTKVSVVDGVVKYVHTTEDRIVTSEEINSARAYIIAEGSTFQVLGIPDGIKVPGKPEDRDTLLALVVTAQIRISSGDNIKTVYRDANNNDFMLTPVQVVELWTKLMAWVELVYYTSWELKALNPIPLNYMDTFKQRLGV